MPKSYSVVDALKTFAIGGLSGAIATCVIQPIDTFKVQIQITSEKLGNAIVRPSLSTILKDIVHQKGIGILYAGIDSAILRQFFYGSSRLGSYNFTIKYCKSKNI